jgi:hypothetical protein
MPLPQPLFSHRNKAMTCSPAVVLVLPPDKANFPAGQVATVGVTSPAATVRQTLTTSTDGTAGAGGTVVAEGFAVLQAVDAPVAVGLLG